MIFFKIFQDFSPQATTSVAVRRPSQSPSGDTRYKFAAYQSMVAAMPRAKSYSGS